MSQRKITMLDVARRAKLSKGSVSKALNNSKQIPYATRQRVIKVAEQLGYRLPSSAQWIDSGPAFSVGLVRRVDNDYRSQPFLLDFIEGLSHHLCQHAYTTTVIKITDTQDIDRVCGNLVATKSVDAFVLPTTTYSDEWAQFLYEREIPFVMYGRTKHCENYAWYDINQEDYFATLVSNLVKLGHRRFAYLGGDDIYYCEHLRKDGFLQGVKNHGITEYTCQQNVVDMDDGRREALRVLQTKKPPTAFVCASDHAAIGVMQAANKLQLQPGKNISVAGYEGLPEGELCDPLLSTCQVDNFNSGMQIADMVLRLISGEKASNLQVLGEARPLLRASVGLA